MSNETGAAVALFDPRLTRYPIAPQGKGYLLTDRKGNRISFHRTISGALRARRTLIERPRTDGKLNALRSWMGGSQRV